MTNSTGSMMAAQAPAHEYATRPKDERFETFADWNKAAEYDRDHCHEARYNLRDLRAVAVNDARGNRVVLESPKAQAEFTHWSYGQLCRTIGAPAAYLRTLPPALAADAMTHGLQDADSTAGKRANVMVRSNGGPTIIRAATSDTYGRAWDAALGAPLMRHFGDGRPASEGGTWQSPKTWTGEGAGQYRGDRDSFLIRIDGGSLVDDPRGFGALSSGKSQGGRLNRGLLVRNSEVGHCSISMELVLLDFICGNHILWGAVLDMQYKRRHVGENAAQDAISEILRIARKYNQRTASEDQRIIQTLVDHDIAASQKAVIDELQKIGYTKQEAADAYATAEQVETTLSPRSFWGIAAGTTRASQDSGHQDDRLRLDALAAKVLRQGVKQYATVGA